MLTTGGRRGRLSARAVVGLVAGAALVAAALVAPPASAQPGDLPPCADFTIVDREPVIDYSNCEGPG
jgi:hypothetical protein